MNVAEESIEEEVAVEELAVGEVEFGQVEEMYRRGLPKVPYGEMSQSTSFWRSLLHCLSSSSDLLWCPWGSRVAETVLALVFFLAEASVIGDAGVTDDADFASDGVGVRVAGVEAGVETDSCSGFLVGEALVDLFSPPFGDFLFFPGHFSPAFVRFRMISDFRLDLARILFFCSVCWLLEADGSCSDCGACGDCSVLLIFWGAKLGNMPQLLTAPTARTSTFHH